jgi:hypothetical protein
VQLLKRRLNGILQQIKNGVVLMTSVLKQYVRGCAQKSRRGYASFAGVTVQKAAHTLGNA